MACDDDGESGVKTISRAKAKQRNILTQIQQTNNMYSYRLNMIKIYV